MKALQPLQLVVLTAKSGSLSAAARALEMTPAAASAALKRLEHELDAVLFVRSTRSLRPTPEGELFLLHCQQALQTLEEAREAVATGRTTVRGVLQVSAPSDLGRRLLLPWLDRFQAAYPELQLRLRLSDRIADFYREPVDAALRYGAPADSSLVAFPLAPTNRRMLCAAPDYLAKHGAPEGIHALQDRNCLCFFVGDHVNDRWRFYRDGNEVSVEVRGDRASDDSDAVTQWTLAGHGIAYRSALDIIDDLESGRLVQLCAEWQGESAPLNLICADRRALSTSVRQLRTFLLDRCEERTVRIAEWTSSRSSSNRTVE